MNVSAIIVTRGDVDLWPILRHLPEEWPKLIWDNGAKRIRMLTGQDLSFEYFDDVEDLSVYGRYAAINYTNSDFIYVQDDDCIVSDPEQIVRAHDPEGAMVILDGPESYVTCNMPQEFRHDFYRDHGLVGFGAVFHRDAPGRAFGQLIASADRYVMANDPWFHRTCDVAFTALTPRVLIDVHVQNLPWADGPNRMYRQPDHVGERKRMLDLALKVRDG